MKAGGERGRMGRTESQERGTLQEFEFKYFSKNLLQKFSLKNELFRLAIRFPEINQNINFYHRIL